MISSEVSLISAELHKAENFRELQLFLAKSGFCGAPVPGDGNCALHTLLALHSGDPGYEDERATHEACVASLRHEVARLWREASTNQGWMRLYEVIIDTWNALDTSENQKHENVAKNELLSEDLMVAALKCEKSEAQKVPHCVGSPAPASVKQEPPVTPPTRRKRCADECVDLSTPPPVEKVGGMRPVMRKPDDRKARSALMGFFKGICVSIFTSCCGFLMVRYLMGVYCLLISVSFFVSC